MAIQRLRDYQGPALLSYGYRPFFFLGSLYAGLSIVLWIPQLYGHLTVATQFAPVDWHIHEMYFGFLAAVITGFLFTAVPNWTGRLPIQGKPLLFIVLIWVAGRLAVTYSSYIGWIAAMILDLLFLSTILAVLTIEIAAGKNWRNLKVLLPLSLLLAANAGFHLEAHFDGASDISRRLAMASAILFILVIGGRIIPSFTRNWLVKNNQGRLPTPFNTFDIITIVITFASLGLWIVAGLNQLSGDVLVLAAVLQFIRLIRWAGDRTWKEPLLMVLHLSYLFIPTGFFLLGLAGSFPEHFTEVAGIHALGTGAIGSMTLSVMLRASLGHSGKPITIGVYGCLIFVCIYLAAISRIAAEFALDHYNLLLDISALAWFLAFTGFAIGFSPLFFRKRR